MYEPPVRYAACWRKTESGPKILHTSIVIFWVGVWDYVGGWVWVVLTSFWAEKIEFMTGMYEFDASGETVRMSIRGSGRFAESSGEPSDWAGCTRRLISRFVSRALGGGGGGGHTAYRLGESSDQCGWFWGAKHRHRLIKGERVTHLQCLVYQGYRTRERYGGRVTDRPF